MRTSSTPPDISYGWTNPSSPLVDSGAHSCLGSEDRNTPAALSALAIFLCP